jgi:hypothetical protein
MMWIIEIFSGGIISLSDFKKIRTGVRAVVGFCLCNFNGCNVGIIERKFYKMHR